MRTLELVAVLSLLILIPVMSMTASEHKVPTFDEPYHLTCGYSIWARGDHRLLDPTHLPQWLMAIPLLFQDVQFISEDDHWWVHPNVDPVARTFFYGLGNDVASMTRAGRGVIALMSVLLGLLVYCWSRSLFGIVGGVISLFVFALSPTFLAHGALMTADLPISLALLFALWCGWRASGNVTWFRVTISSLAVAACCLTKASGVLIIPMLLLLIVFRTVHRKPIVLKLRSTAKSVSSIKDKVAIYVAVTVLHVAVVVSCIWAFHHFRFSAFSDATADETAERWVFNWEQKFENPDVSMKMIRFALDHKLLPEAYLRSFALFRRMTDGRPSFMNGQWSRTGRLDFFLYAFWVKTPIAVQVCLILALCLLAFRIISFKRTSQESDECIAEEAHLPLTDAIPLLVLIAVYFAIAMTSKINIGHRHILPIYAPLFILLGVTGSLLTKGRFAKPGALCLLMLMLWLAVESFMIRPHYLAYFNQWAGGPELGYRRLVDSSLDWGQDLALLRDRVDEYKDAGSVEDVYLSYFGTADPKYYGLDIIPLPSFKSIERANPIPRKLSGGLYCISASRLQIVNVKLMGPWSSRAESRYRHLLGQIERWWKAGNDRQKQYKLARDGGSEYWVRVFSEFEELRFARMVSHLQTRNPDDNVGYSILIFNLSDHDLDQMQFGPRNELVSNTN